MDSRTAATEELRKQRRTARWGRSVIDGAHPWGDLNVRLADRTGCAVRYQLTVYPPGITDAERRVLVFRGHWPTTGIILALVLSALLGTFLNGWAALAAGAAVFAAGYVVTTLLAGDARRRTVRLTATVVNSMGHRQVLGDLNAIEHGAGMLLKLDELDGEGLLSRVDHELLWGRIHEELEQRIR